MRSARCIWRSLRLLLALLILVSEGLEAQVEEVVTIDDQTLEYYVRQAIAKPTGDIYASDLAALTGTLEVGERGISSLEGRQYCTSLTGLRARYSYLTDISPLSGLTAPESLTCS